MNKLRVLVVNDDGQKAEHLAQRLESADHSALPAAGLEEAREALFVQKFDAVLLCSQLPADGVAEFAAKLRELERGQRRAVPAPVLSISSHIPNGADWCAGEGAIDGYLAESFQSAVLSEAVTSLAAAIAQASEQSSSVSSELPVLEIEEFRAQVGQDPDLMREIIDLFLLEGPSQVIELRQAMANGDFERAARLAHTIKGSFATLHAQRARSHAQQLETAARERNTTQCRESLSGLEYDLEVLEPQLLAVREACTRR
jgi:HPt (histidine-containing phosphotransfer) domain-containing protein/CheY-like chemotaxis protein